MGLANGQTNGSSGRSGPGPLLVNTAQLDHLRSSAPAGTPVASRQTSGVSAQSEIVGEVKGRGVSAPRGAALQRSNESPWTPVYWLKAGDDVLEAAPRGWRGPDGKNVSSEAALIVSSGEASVVSQGTSGRLLRALDNARSTLLAAAPRLEIVGGKSVPPESDQSDATRRNPRQYGLKCPRCSVTATASSAAAVIAVDDKGQAIECHWDPLNQRLFPDSAVGRVDHFECAACRQPIALPRKVALAKPHRPVVKRSQRTSA